MNNKLIKVTTGFARFFEVMCWIGEAGMWVFLLAVLFGGDTVSNALAQGFDDGSITITGFNINVIAADGSLIKGALIMAIVFGIVSMVMAAMICRNIRLIFMKETPFCEDNIRMVREIGIFSIAIPVVGLILSVIAGLVFGQDTTEVNVDTINIFFGLVVLSLSQFFKYGAQLENEVDGLV